MIDNDEAREDLSRIEDAADEAVGDLARAQGARDRLTEALPSLGSDDARACRAVLAQLTRAEDTLLALSALAGNLHKDTYGEPWTYTSRSDFR